MGKPFRECPDCGAHLDAGETCDCKQEARPVERVPMTLVAICRETDPDTGEISVFKVDARADNRLLTELTARARRVPELRYFTLTAGRWERFREVITAILKRERLTAADVDRIGGIVEL